MKKYPDMTELFALKKARRREIAGLPIGEKMKIAQRLSEIGRRAPGRHVQPKNQRVRITRIASRGRKKQVA
jgi:hypothetical protein